MADNTTTLKIRLCSEVANFVIRQATSRFPDISLGTTISLNDFLPQIKTIFELKSSPEKELVKRRIQLKLQDEDFRKLVINNLDRIYSGSLFEKAAQKKLPILAGLLGYTEEKVQSDIEQIRKAGQGGSRPSKPRKYHDPTFHDSTFHGRTFRD